MFKIATALPRLAMTCLCHGVHRYAAEKNGKTDDEAAPDRAGSVPWPDLSGMTMENGLFAREKFDHSLQLNYNRTYI